MASNKPLDSFFRRFFSWGKEKKRGWTEPWGGVRPKSEWLDSPDDSGRSWGRGTYYWVPGTNDYYLNRIESSIRQGNLFSSGGNYAQARAGYEEALEKAHLLHPPLTSSQAEKKARLQSYAHWGLADLYLSQKEFDLARKHLDLGLASKEPQNHKEYHWLGASYLKLGHGLLGAQRRPEALAVYEQAAGFKPSLDDRAHLELAREWAAQGRSDLEAVRKYLHYLHPSEWTKGALKALIFQGCKIAPECRTEDLPDRIILNQQVIAFHPEAEWVHKNLGLGYFFQKQYDKSREYLERAREIRGMADLQSYFDYTFWIGKTSFQAKDYQRCARELESLLPQQIPAKVRGEYELHYGLSQAHLFFGPPDPVVEPLKVEEIERHLRNSQEMGKNSGEALYFLGRIKFVQNRSQEALDLFEEVVKIDPYNPRGLIKLAETLLEVKPERRSEAKEFLKKAHILLGAEEVEEDAEVMMTLSDLLQEEGNRRESDIWFERAQRVCPHNGMVLLKSCRQQMVAGEYAQAYRTASGIASLSERILREKHFILGRCSLRLNKQPVESEALLQKALDLGMDGWAQHYWLGISQARQQKYNRSKERLLASLKKRNRQAARTLLQLGNIMLLQEDLEEGRRFFSLARKVAQKEFPREEGGPLYREALYSLGRCDYRLGNREAAEQSFLELLGIDEGHTGAQYFLGLIAEDRQDPAACEDWLRRIIARGDRLPERARAFLGSAYRRLGILLCRQGETETLAEAEELLEKAGTLGHQDPEAVYYRGLIKALRGEWDAAYQGWSQLQDLPEVALNLNLLNYQWGISLFAAGNYHEALRRFEEAHSLNVAEWRAEVYFRRGLDLLHRGQREEAREALEKAAAINPGVDLYRLGQGLAALLKGEEGLAAAETLFAAIVKDNPQEFLAAYSLEICRYLQGGEKKAAACRQLQHLSQQPAVAGKCRTLAQLILGCEDLESGHRDSLEGLLQLLKDPEIRNNLPFSPGAFNTKLACNLIRLYDREAVQVAEYHAQGAGRDRPLPWGPSWPSHHAQEAGSDLLSYCLALVHSLRGEPARALEYFETLCKPQAPDRAMQEQYAGVLCYVASQEIRQDKKDQALAHLHRAKEVLSY